jgi:AraC-like DNA-binding protein
MTFESAPHEPSISPACQPSGPGHRREINITEEVGEILDDVRRALEEDLAGARAAALRLLSFLVAQVESEPANARGGLAPWRKRKIDRYLREHLDQPLRVEELADQVSLSVGHFCRAFKESFTETPHSHIMRLRLELAQRLMLTTDDSLSHIALDCGLSDQAHLSKLFRQRIGETPSSWRRLNLGGSLRSDARGQRRRPRNRDRPQRSRRPARALR